MNINFNFPPDTNEDYATAEDFPALPRVGDYIESSKPKQTRFRVKAVVFRIDPESKQCDSITAELELASNSSQ